MNTEASKTPFRARLHAGIERGGFEVDDVLAAVLPLFRQVAEAHERQRVAPLQGLAHVTVGADGRLGFDPVQSRPARHNRSRVDELQDVFAARAITILGKVSRETDFGDGSESVSDLSVIDAGTEPRQPAYIPGHVAWEHAIGHHDELTDVFSLGLLLAGLALGLDFTERDELEQFVAARGNLFVLNPRLNPVLAAVMCEMTELDRHRRVQDLPGVIRRLESWRDQPVDVDWSAVAGRAGEGAGVAGRRRVIQEHLRDRLFEISRRNRLLYFKPSLGTVNLTVASVPLVLDWRSIQPDRLFYWHPGLAREIAAGDPLSLGRWLRFEDAPYLAGSLDQIVSTARRDRAEFGFAQLRLVLVFLRWHNLKEVAAERVHSPLLLLPCELTRKRGVRDQYVLDPTSHEAEVNPALRHHLRQLYGLELPESVDLRETPLADFHADLAARIRASEPGVTLELVDKPRIHLIQERARQRVNQFRRRQRTAGRPLNQDLSNAATDYSYAREDFRPRGLQIFHERVKPSPAPMRDAADRPPGRPLNFGAESPPAAPLPPVAREGNPPGEARPAEGGEGQRRFAVRESEQDATGNPYAWEFDLTALTLGNFNYRKMTLVRDYTNLVESGPESASFDRVFSLQPRPPEESAPAALPPDDQFLVVPADATQVGAISRARSGDSYIIQGPPGTGKSQTITNLIADQVARGRRVLFVCEKRAAIDVVFHRLRQQGLDELCCLIHDSQTDKKAFVLNLKQTYEAWLAVPDGESDPEADRTRLVRGLNLELEGLARFSEAMTAVPPDAGVPVHALIHRLIELEEDAAGARAVPGSGGDLSPEQLELLPGYAAWTGHGGTLTRLARALADVGADGCFARHPSRWLAAGVVHSGSPLRELRTRLESVGSRLDQVLEGLRAAGCDVTGLGGLDAVAELFAHAGRAAALLARGQAALLAPGAAARGRLENRVTELASAEAGLNQAAAKTVHWRERLSPGDTQAALAQARGVPGPPLGWFSPVWWRLRRLLNERYNFSAHAVAPPWTQVLGDLEAAQKAEAAVAAVRESTAREFGTAEPSGLLQEVDALHAAGASAPAGVRAFHQRLGSPEAAAMVQALCAVEPAFRELRTALPQLLVDPDSLPLSALGGVLEGLRDIGDQLPELLPVLADVVSLPADLGRALRELPIPVAGYEAALARASLGRALRQDRAMERFDGALLSRRAAKAGELQGELLARNAAAIRARVRGAFRRNVELSTVSATQLDAAGKQFKKRYTAGRRDLEHEFGKTMRYKSIRDLAAGDTGAVVRDLKPVWLMSPLSVSDALPLEPGLFDVVIFDEASQIPVEEAVPALYRASQVIVVGDEMQLPPTNFFSARDSTAEEGLVAEEDGERVAVSLEADSFLTQSAQNLPATLLAWHYRSRYEALISFSNAAFYGNELFTIPDRTVAAVDVPELVARTPEDAVAHAPAVLERSVSFHFCPESVYEDRRNPAEAAYLARLVRQLLAGRPLPATAAAVVSDPGNTAAAESIPEPPAPGPAPLSLGIVAFSEAQQDEIERALETLAGEDPEFGARLEAERNREEEDQFCGLFVKNLENVQGDERDIILLSICYGPDTRRAVRMNFGPINQRGGEKRLNVIFSRARHHMAVVSSLRHGDITNDWNDGAAVLKQFLRYAEAVSKGDADGARRVLGSLNPLRRKRSAGAPEHGVPCAVVRQLAAALDQRGWEVCRAAGQSRFRCDLAVRSKGSGWHELAVFVDDRAHYSNPDIAERHVTRPSILQAFGWRVITVLAKDWLTDPESVVRRVERELRRPAAGDRAPATA